VTPATDEPCILRAEALCKAFAQRAGLRSFWRGAIGPGARYALDDVSFTLARGEALGVIGHNGAGKSTLLRLVAGLTQPTRGRMETSGRLACLLDLSAGLVEEWSGEENARAGLRLQGVAAAEIPARLEEVRDFAELGRHWHEALRTWSAGMRLRLGYSLAIAGDPEIFVVDEVLAVGDEGFARKCSLHVSGFLEHGGTLVLASHNLYQVEKLCGSALWLNGGRVEARGISRDVTAAYRDWVEARAKPGKDLPTTSLAGEGRLRLVGHPRDRSTVELRFEEPLCLRVDVAGLGTEDLALEVCRQNGALVSTIELPGTGELEIEGGQLLPGGYRIQLVETGGEVLEVAELRVVGDRRELGTIYLEHEWEAAACAE
jgi:lipopolysaccharide transport system ATP-binding protein